MWLKMNTVQVLPMLWMVVLAFFSFRDFIYSSLVFSTEWNESLPEISCSRLVNTSANSAYFYSRWLEWLQGTVRFIWRWLVCAGTLIPSVKQTLRARDDTRVEDNLMDKKSCTSWSLLGHSTLQSGLTTGKISLLIELCYPFVLDTPSTHTHTRAHPRARSHFLPRWILGGVAQQVRLYCILGLSTCSLLEDTNIVRLPTFPAHPRPPYLLFTRVGLHSANTLLASGGEWEAAFQLFFEQWAWGSHTFWVFE